MGYLNIDSSSLWALYDEEENNILCAFTSQEEAILKLGDFEDVTPLQIADITRKEDGWAIRTLSWKEVVFDLVRKVNS